MYPCLWDGPGAKERGLALILNYEFKNQPDEREGSGKDVENLTEVLKRLGYKIWVPDKLSYEATVLVLQSFMEDPIHGADTTDSTIVVVMSHGTAGNEWTGSTFQTEDRRTMASQPLIERFQTVASLIGKPKIFFFNFCRGSLDGNPEEGQIDKEVTDKYFNEDRFLMDANAVNSTWLPDKTGRPYEDTLIACSTVPRFVSNRDPTKGSIYIQMLCQVLGNDKRVAQKPLSSLLLEVDKLMEMHGKQTPETLIRGFNKDFYFISFHKLRKYYRENVCLVKPLPWYPERCLNIEEVYTELTIEKTNDIIPLEELFLRVQDRPGASNRIVIEGDPGYGKTTLMLKLVTDWTMRFSNNYLSEFRLVLFLRLERIDNGDVEKHMMNLYQNEYDIPVPCLLKTKEVARVLILLDGYDEASDATKNFVQKVMKNELWSQCHVVLTSRFGYMSNKANALCTRLKGFGRSQVAVAVGKFFVKACHLSKEDVVANSFRKVTTDDLKYIEQVTILSYNERITPDQYREFFEKVTESEPYNELAQSPLLCAMLCSLVADFPDRKLPSTLTELYFAIINLNLYRAYRKKTEISKENAKEWNWNILRDKFRKDSEKYLKEFGAVCLNYLKAASKCFTLFELTENSEDCDPNDDRVVRLIEAGVLIKSTEFSTRTTFHPTHRSMAEFLAAYYLTAEEDVEAVTRHLLELYVEKRCFREIYTLCWEMKRGKIVADAFRDIKFGVDSDSLYRKFLANIPPDKDSKKTEEFWTEIGSALPGHLEIDYNKSFFEQILQRHPNFLSVKMLHPEDFSPSQNLEHAADICGLLKRSLSVQHASRYLYVKKTNNSNPDLMIFFNETSNWTVLFQNLTDEGVQLGTVTFDCLHMQGDSSGNDQLYKNLQILQCSACCPETLHFIFHDESWLPAVYEGLKDPPESCKLKRITFDSRCGIGNFPNWRQLVEVLMKYWLPNRLQEFHLWLKWGSYFLIKPIITCICKFTCLSALTLTNLVLDGEDSLHLVTGLLGSPVEKLQLLQSRLTFEGVADLAKRVATCRIKSLKLADVNIHLEDTHLYKWSGTQISLEELYVHSCDFPSQLRDWLGASVRGLRILGLALNRNEKTKNVPLFNAITLNNGNTLKELILTDVEFGKDGLLPMDAREAVFRCEELETLNFSIVCHTTVVQPWPILGLIKILRRLELKELGIPYGFEMEDGKAFCEALADLADRWPGKDPEVPDVETNSSLTLVNFPPIWAALAVLVFREKKLNYRLKYVEHNMYEIWFPKRL